MFKSFRRGVGNWHFTLKENKMATEDVVFGTHYKDIGSATCSDPMVVGPKIGAWALPQTDNFGDPISPGAHPDVGINGVSTLADYACAQHLADSPAGYEVAYQACVANGSLALTKPPTTAPTQLSGRMPIGDATNDDFFYCYKLSIAGRNIAEVLMAAFSGQSDQVGTAYNNCINNHQAEATAFDADAYSGPLKGI